VNDSRLFIHVSLVTIHYVYKKYVQTTKCRRVNKIKAYSLKKKNVLENEVSLELLSKNILSLNGMQLATTCNNYFEINTLASPMNLTLLYCQDKKISPLITYSFVSFQK